MGQIVTVNKKLVTGQDGGPEMQPDTTAPHWQKVSETATEMTIEIIE